MSTSRATSTPEPPWRAARYSRLAASRTLGHGAMEPWYASTIAVIGCGGLGELFAIEAVRSGASVLVLDPDTTEERNLGNQGGEPGRPKVATFLERAERIAPGRTRVAPVDARHVGVGTFREVDLLVDTSDDPTLSFPFVLLSNGLGLPFLRLAIDGSGGREYGRVACSHGGAGHACAACSWRREDLGRASVPTPCPDHGDPERAPTLAGRAISLAIAGIGLIQAQRLLGGNEAGAVLGRELLLDLDGGALLPLELDRVEACVSRHERWDLFPTGLDATETTVEGLFAVASRELGGAEEVELEAWLHPLFLQCWCRCGATARAVGTRWAPTPSCPECGDAMHWRREMSLQRFNRRQARPLEIEGRTCASLGLPERGALVLASAPTVGEPRRLLLA